MALSRAASAPSVALTLKRLRREVVNWYTAGLLASIVMPSRVPPRRGLAGTRLGRFVMTFRMSDGSRIRCRLQDAGDLLSVYVEADYGRMTLPWADMRTIVDIGSTVGSFTVWAAQLSPTARFIAVEPNPDVYPFLVANVRLNDLTVRATTVEAALGAVSGWGVIENVGAFSTLIRVVPYESGKGPTVRLLTLERLFQDAAIQRCDLLKIDCEGAEYDILLTAPESVLERVGTVVCEYHPTTHHDPVELTERLTKFGFRVERDKTPLGFLLATRED
jgi:FkbM family methyltransferase